MSFYPTPVVGLGRGLISLELELCGRVIKIRKNYLGRWSEVCSPKKHGGLGVHNLELMNKSLLAKWLWKLET